MVSDDLALLFFFFPGVSGIGCPDLTITLSRSHQHQGYATMYARLLVCAENELFRLAVALVPLPCCDCTQVVLPEVLPIDGVKISTISVNHSCVAGPKILELLYCRRDDSRINALPSCLWPVTCRNDRGSLQEESAYNSHDNFPCSGSGWPNSKISAFDSNLAGSGICGEIEETHCNETPVWAVLVFGGVSMLIAVLQLLYSRQAQWALIFSAVWMPEREDLTKAQLVNKHGASLNMDLPSYSQLICTRGVHQVPLDRLFRRLARPFCSYRSVPGHRAWDRHIFSGTNCMIVPISTSPQCFPTGQNHEKWNLEPDWSSLRCCGFASSHATVMCFVDLTSSDTRYGRCPRTLLKRTLSQQEDVCVSSQLLMRFEIEFVLLNESLELYRPLDRVSGISRTAGLRGEILKIVEQIIQALKASSIEMWHFHTEVADQLEIALAPQRAMNAIDSLILAQETIRTVSAQHGLKATLCAIGMANYDGYARVIEDGAGEWIGYGTENRDVPVRKINEHHLEIRVMDSTANPYLFVAGVIACGLDGLGNETPLTWKDCKLLPDKLDAKQRAAHAMDKPMPRSLRHALGYLAEDITMQARMTNEILHEYISVKNKEVEVFKTMTDEQRRVQFVDYEECDVYAALTIPPVEFIAGRSGRLIKLASDSPRIRPSQVRSLFPYGVHYEYRRYRAAHQEDVIS
nr:protein flug [Quercus suber]